MTPSVVRSHSWARAGSVAVSTGSSPSAASSRAARRSREGRLQQRAAVDRQQVEGGEAGGDLLGQQRDPRRRRVEPLLQQAEVLVAAVARDHDLAVGDVAAGREDDLGEVAPQGLAGARLHHDVVAVHEDDRPEAVELALVRPAVALRHLAGRAGELGRDGRGERQAHPAEPTRGLALDGHARRGSRTRSRSRRSCAPARSRAARAARTRCGWSARRCGSRRSRRCRAATPTPP